MPVFGLGGCSVHLPRLREGNLRTHRLDLSPLCGFVGHPRDRKPLLVNVGKCMEHGGWAWYAGSFIFQ